MLMMLLVQLTGHIGKEEKSSFHRSLVFNETGMGANPFTENGEGGTLTF